VPRPKNQRNWTATTAKDENRISEFKLQPQQQRWKTTWSRRSTPSTDARRTTEATPLHHSDQNKKKNLLQTRGQDLSGLRCHRRRLSGGGDMIPSCPPPFASALYQLYGWVWPDLSTQLIASQTHENLKLNKHEQVYAKENVRHARCHLLASVHGPEKNFPETKRRRWTSIDR
jgi:hypothetical protein